MMYTSHQLRRHEHGGVLIVGILTLIMLTAIGIAAMTSSMTENDIAANELRQKEAFYATEIALTFAENLVNTVKNPNDLPDKIDPGYYEINKQPAWEVMKWDNTDSVEIDPLPAEYPTFAALPRFTIASLGVFPVTGIGLSGATRSDAYFYRVAGHGTGRNSSAKAVVTTIQRRVVTY